MKRLLIACLAATISSIAHADDPKPPPKQPSINIAAGTVTKIDVEKKTFELKLTEEKTQTFSVGEQTRFTKDDKDFAFADLAVGNYLRFTFRQNADGTATASRVFVSEKAPTVEAPPAEKVPEEKSNP